MTYVQRVACVVFLNTLAVVLGACASATRPAGAERPRGSEPPKLAVLNASDERLAAALANWKAVVGEQAADASPTPELRPVTATVAALPAGLRDLPRLPLVVAGDPNSRTEEETRESLRRFLATAMPLLGVDLKHVSLVGIEPAPSGDGARRAEYRQTPFAYPLRNGYGVIEVTFAPDLRVVGLSSTAIPDAERLGRTLATVAQNLPADSAGLLVNRAVTYTAPGGSQQTYTLTRTEVDAARQLVVYPIRKGDAAAETLELHIAWEISLTLSGAQRFVYLDAFTGEQLGEGQSNRPPSR